MQEILNLNKNNCTDCYKCIRDCSVKAITFAKDTAEIVHNDCILCGRCYVTCPQKAKQVRNDVHVVKAAIAAGRRVVCSLAPSFFFATQGPMNTVKASGCCSLISLQ